MPCVSSSSSAHAGESRVKTSNSGASRYVGPTIRGVIGSAGENLEQLEVVVGDLPKDYSSLCAPSVGAGCVDIAPVSNDAYDAAAYFKEVNERKVFVLEDVKGDTVMIWYAAPPDEFDELATEAQKVVESVKWSGS